YIPKNKADPKLRWTTQCGLNSYRLKTFQGPQKFWMELIFVFSLHQSLSSFMNRLDGKNSIATYFSLHNHYSAT
ncbi:hypothetical protein ABK046_45390, partial [Streptomyces caeruleatus]